MTVPAVNMLQNLIMMNQVPANEDECPNDVHYVTSLLLLL